MEDWVIWLILGTVAAASMFGLSYFVKKMGPKVVFALLGVGVVLGTIWAVGPQIDIGEAPPLDVEPGVSTADWRMISQTESMTWLNPKGVDDYKITATYNDTSNQFEGLTQFAEVAYRFQNFGAADGSGVICTITDYGSFYYDVTDDTFFMISKTAKKFNSNWTVDGTTAVNQIDSVTVPSSTETKIGLVTLNLTANAAAMEFMTPATDTATTTLVFTNSISGVNIATIDYDWEKTIVTT